ncbi:MAG: trifunctional transcriptional regulator/proline dehydrogenase/L-glutamate gamma-semialdehyde dehydrogenase, partial [Burkholderiaceae bacterium]
MATTTLGVKVDESLRERLKASADKLGCTPHWLHKQALLAYVEAIERGQLPAEIAHFNQGDGDAETGDLPKSEILPAFYEFAQDVRPQSVLRAAITSAYRRPETECLPLLIDQARSTQTADVHALARR